MKNVIIRRCVLVLCVLLFSAGCTTTTNVKVARLKLGMTPDEVIRQIGKPYTIRAAKVYEDNEWAEVWEYLPPSLTWNPKTYWVYFENGKVVQWGEPGDFTGGSGANVSEYSSQKRIQ